MNACDRRAARPTFVRLIEPGTSSLRVGLKPDRIEREDAAFHERVAAGYEELAALFPERVIVLDGSPDPDALGGGIHGEFSALAEQPEARLLLASAVKEVRRTPTFHGPAGVGKRKAARAFAAELLGDERRVEAGMHPDPFSPRRSRDDPDRRDPRAAPRPACARSRQSAAST